MVRVPEVAEFVKDDVFPARAGGFDESRVEKNLPTGDATAPAFGHAEEVAEFPDNLVDIFLIGGGGLGRDGKVGRGI